ncbi:hypothetical protein H311_04456 [Anncaliia algerae PRA109]|nr:hypothetical protein H311_04456 [Anncaliia algerae PRA109]
MDIDVFSKRKYNIVRIVTSLWVVVDVEIRTGDSFFVEIIKRDSATLSQIILDNVEIETVIYNDC